MAFTADQTKALAAPLDPKFVVKPTGGAFGPKGDYLEGWHVIAELNRVFGFDGWSYTIDLRQDALTEATDSRGNPQWQAAYTCICTLTVNGVVRQDVGFGSGFAKGVGDAVEGATKEAVTDALKRAARTFGNPFGLALYDKSRANVQSPPAEPAPVIDDAQFAEIVSLAAAAGVPVARILETAKVPTLKDLPAADYEAVRKKLNLTIDANVAKKEAA
jgi:DNA recombination protein Rad52